MDHHLDASFYCASDRADITSLCVLLHGLGANGADLMPIGRQWAKELPHTGFFSPNAPEPFLPFESGSYRWFNLQVSDASILETGLLKSAQILNAFLDDLLEEFKLTNDRLILMGFSQGAAMALHVGLRRGNPVMGYSGGILLREENPTLKNVPVLLVHGTHDEVLPIDHMHQATAYLTAHDITPQTLTCPGMGHCIDEAGLSAGLAFLKNHLKIQ